MHFKAEGSPMAYGYKLNSLFLSFSVGSAGVGRTGVFCALSLLIERLKAEGVVDAVSYTHLTLPTIYSV